MKLDWHSKSTTDVLNELRTSEHGLEKHEAKKRLELYGPNKLPDSKKISYFRILIDQFKNALVIILIIAVIISFFLNEYIDASVILLIVVINTFIGFWQELKAEQAIESLRKVNPTKSLVLRDNKQHLIDSIDIVPGDILILNSGDKVGADARLLEVAELKVNESILTGEFIGEEKFTEIIEASTVVADRKNMVFSATTVESGRGKAVVVSTGEETEVGKIATLVNTEKKDLTPLQKRLNQFTSYITKITLIVIIPIIILSYFRGESWIHIFELSISLAVSAVPEGLAVIVTIALALGIKRMFKNNVLIRKLPVVEVLGSTDIICTDKTGTITTNQMTANEFYMFNKVVDLADTSKLTRLELEEMKDIFKLFILSSDADAEGGDPTEIGLIKKAHELGLDSKVMREKNKRISEIPFSSEYKYMATSISDIGMLVKGAPEKVIELCGFVRVGSKIEKLTADKKEKILKINAQIASEGGRVLALAIKKEKQEKVKHEHLKDFIFEGLVSLIDPPRIEVAAAIKDFYAAGIRVIVITGDNELTAQAIAKKVGIKTDGALTGYDLDKLDEKELCEKVEKVSIYARVNSEHKLKILKALQKNGHIVAMGGDGVNDSPAIKKSDIGFSVGSGTELAKEVSDMILLDDNFATLPNAIREGRIIFQNIRNFLKLLLSSNFDEILLITTSIIVGAPLALVPIQILWINLLTDGLPALALAVDGENEDVMKKHPNSDKDALFKGLLQFIAITGIIAFIMAFALFSAVYPWWNDEFKPDGLLDKARTMVFAASVCFDLVLVFICRTKYFAFGKYAWNNVKLLGAVIISFVLLAFAIYVPLLNEIFSTVALSLQEIIVVGIFVFVATSLLEIFKLVYYRNKEF
jgi:Ca2+-transporting ATPase